MGDGGMGHRVLFRVGWKHIFCIAGFGNVSPSHGTQKKHTVLYKQNGNVFLFGFMIFYFLFCFFLYLLNFFRIDK